MHDITEAEITDACSELETVMLTLFEERDNDAHYDAIQDCLRTLGAMADALLDEEDHADLGGLYGLPDQ